MKRSYEVKINGKTFTVTPKHETMEVIVNGENLKLTFDNEKVRQEKLDSPETGPTLVQRTAEEDRFCIICNGRVHCDFGCVHTDCGSMCI